MSRRTPKTMCRRTATGSTVHTKRGITTPRHFVTLPIKVGASNGRRRAHRDGRFDELPDPHLLDGIPPEAVDPRLRGYGHRLRMSPLVRPAPSVRHPCHSTDFA